MTKKTNKKKDFITMFKAYTGHGNLQNVHNWGTATDTDLANLSDYDKSRLDTDFVYYEDSRYTYFFTKNRIFSGPFQLDEYRNTSATGVFNVRLTTRNNLNITIAIRAETVLQLMKSGDVQGDLIMCPLTIGRFGSSHFLVKVEDESN